MSDFVPFLIIPCKSCFAQGFNANLAEIRFLNFLKTLYDVILRDSVNSETVVFSKQLRIINA